MQMGTNQINNVKQNFLYEYRSFFILTLFLLLAGGITWIMFGITQVVLKERLQERIIAIATTAATQFDPKKIAAINDSNDINKPELKILVNQLQRIRNANTNLKYAYIMRRTDSNNILHFVADADMLTPAVDSNNNGKIEENEFNPVPGDEYDATEYPVLRDQAFYHPAADNDLQADKWGLIQSAYAPIFDDQNQAVAIIGIDVLANDFNAQTKALFVPFLLFIIFLVLMLVLLTLILIRIWNAKVKAVEELDRQKDELLAMVSHQLATPVASLKWYIEMLYDGDLGKISKEQKEQLVTMGSISQNLADLVSMILDVSRIQLGRIKIEKQELDLETLFKEILDTIEPKAKQKNIEMKVNIPNKFPKASLDRRYTHMTIENLLTNAIKYTSENGNILFNVEIRDNKLYCEVKDNGIGIPKEEQSKIFGKMYRATNARNLIDGNGFGLYVAKGAIEAQGGKIWFSSKEKKGTTFYIDLPLN